MSNNAESNLSAELKRGFVSQYGLFLGMGVISLAGFLVDLFFVRMLQTTKQMSLYLQCFNGTEMVLYIVVICWFMVKNKGQFKYRIQSYQFYLSCLIWIVIPVLSNVIRMCISSIDNDLTFIVTDASRSLQVGLLVSLMLFVGLLFHKRFLLLVGAGVLLVYFLSYLVGDTAVFSRSLTQAGVINSTLVVHLKEWLVSFVYCASSLILGIYACYEKKHGKI